MSIDSLPLLQHALASPSAFTPDSITSVEIVPGLPVGEAAIPVQRRTLD
jgi:hypothetical protein